MSLARIKAMCMRYLYFFGRFDNIAENFYWPVIDIFLWGMTSVWIQSAQTEISDVAVAILIGLVFFQVIWRSSYEISLNILHEFWGRNLVNIFATPLRFGEWAISLMVVGLLKSILVVFFSAIIIWLFYTVNVFQIGLVIIPYVAMLIVSGWWIGFLTAAVLIYMGQRVQMLAWMLPFLFAPFSAIFYPVSVLPTWAQGIAHCLPTTYVFEGMRQVLNEGTFSTSLFMTGLVLDLLFFTAFFCLFRLSFEKSRAKGLSRLE